MEEITKTAHKYAVKNAFEHGGEAQIGAVVGKVKALFPKADLKKVMPQISKAVLEVNKMKKDALEEEYKKFEAKGWELKHIEKEKSLPELEWLKKGEKIITRVAPNPSGAMHFGHARPAVLTDEYVKRYSGKYILRFDDTDPKVKVPIAGIEKEFMRDFEWLGIKFDEVGNASDRLERYYEIIEELIKKGHAYVCSCESEKWRELIWKSKECPCRKKDAKVQMAEWKKMLSHEIKEEQAVVRLKTDLKNKDPSTRDWWMAKVVDEVYHPNQKTAGKHVWPSYNLASAVDDHDMEINFIIRGQEHVSNEEKQRALYEIFKWKYPHTEYFGKISKIGDMTLSKSKMKEIMEAKGVENYDDPRMATIMAFRRRGFTPQAIRKVIVDCGVSMKEVKITLDNFAAANKAVLGEAQEYPFFEEAVKMDVYNLSSGSGECYGEKVEFETGVMELFVDKKELIKYSKKKGALVRFKKAFNAKIDEANEFGGKATFISYSKTDNPILSWVHEMIDVEILMSDGSLKRGFSAPSLLNATGMVHFEGLGYANIEAKKDGIIKCVYAYE
ncbi:Glutamate--tRNA ligase [uncultured archaeon]|nr:Glutamate--tRNA ligase [uncultured archaeon]